MRRHGQLLMVLLLVTLLLVGADAGLQSATAAPDIPTTPIDGPGGYPSTDRAIQQAAAKTYSVSGYVRDRGNNPLAGVSISDTLGHSTTTGDNGYYSISGLSSGQYAIVPFKAGYTFSPGSRTGTVPPNASKKDFVGVPGLGWYRYQGESDSGSCATNNCGPASVAMAIQLVHDGQRLPIQDIRSYIAGKYNLKSCTFTNLTHLADALAHWNVSSQRITGMDAILESIRYGNIVIAPLLMSDLSKGVDYQQNGLEPLNHYNRYSKYSGYHILVVKGLSSEGAWVGDRWVPDWVVVNDPNVFNGNGVYWYNNGAPKGMDRYYRYSEFVTALGNNGNSSLEIQPWPVQPPVTPGPTNTPVPPTPTSPPTAPTNTPTPWYS